MRARFIFFTLVLMTLALAACDGAPAATDAGGQTPTAATPGLGGNRPANFTPGAQRPANFTPGAQQPGGQRPANFTPGAQQPGAQRTPAAASTSVPSSAPTAAPTTNSIAPTAVPIPQVLVPTQIPSNVQAAATPTAASDTSAPAAASTATPSPTPSAVTSLDALRGKIVFFSDRGGGYAQLYVMNADGSNQQLCNCSDLLQTLVANDVSSPDKQQSLFVKQVGGGARGGGDAQIWAHDNATQEGKSITGGAPGFSGVDYDPSWSPNARYIAWVSETNGFDEIYLYDRTNNENTRLTESHGEWYKHPSFSPDGSQITYWTNRDDANRKQIWVMHSDGSNPINLSHNAYNDWDPIWVK